ncbi:MAG: hypothetical protein GC172_05175 [Phycisphaera sp.]|nr:hypothetical protein [Phycisphaera sp.]
MGTAASELAQSLPMGLAGAPLAAVESMSRAEVVEWLLAAALLVIGASLALRPRVWIRAFAAVASHPLTPLLGGLYALLVGLVIVVLHNLWVADLRVLVTILGWLAVASGVTMLLAPEVYMMVLRRIPLTTRLVAIRGVVRMVLGGAILSYLLTHAG